VSVRSRGTFPAVCAHTGLTVPECSCRDCVEDLIRQTSPDVLEPEPARLHPVAEIAQEPQPGTHGDLGELAA